VFPVRYELYLYILFRRHSVFTGLIIHSKKEGITDIRVISHRQRDQNCRRKMDKSSRQNMSTLVECTPPKAAGP
jgi:hypothetical protein